MADRIDSDFDFDIGASIMVKLPRIEAVGQSVGVFGIPKFARHGGTL
jgi:hypothetical protein